jgi:AcrR family transcriptional regulator
VSESSVRERILDAAFAAFIGGGYAATSTAEIAARARVSKRELYALVGNKQDMLIACISARARRLRLPPELPPIRDRKTLAHVLVSFGGRLVREVSDSTVIATFRLAIAEAVRAPQVAVSLDSIGRESTRVALRTIMVQAKKSKLLNGSPSELAQLFAALLFGDLLVSLLLGVAKQPSSHEIEKRAEDASAAFLRLCC